MKNAKKLLLAATAAILGLAGCGEAAESSTSTSIGGDSSETSSSTSTVSATSITNNLGSYPFVVGESIDFDEYITVNYNDGSSDKAYSISSSSAAVTVSDHIVTFEASGEYTLTIASDDGARTIRASVTARTEATMEVIDFLYPILETPQNFTFRLYQTANFTNFSYHTTLLVNETYTAIFNEGDPDGQNGLFGDSTILAQLSDGYYYWGAFVSDEDVAFEPGYDTNADNYYIRMPSGLDPLDFDEYALEEGDDSYIAGSEAVSEAIFESINNIVATYYQYYGYDPYSVVYGEAEVLGWSNAGDELLILPVFYAPWSGSYTYFSDLIVGIRDIGDSHNAIIENAQASESYLPESIYPTPVETAFATAKETGNYTVEMAVIPMNGEASDFLYSIDESHAWAVYTGLTSAMIQTNTVAEDGVWSDYYQYQDAANEQEAGFANLASWGYKQEEGSVIYYSNAEADNGYDSETVEGATSVSDVANAVAATVDAVSGLSELNITTAEEQTYTDSSSSETYTEYYYESEVGDDDGTTKTNTLFETLWNQFTAYQTFGTSLAESVEFTSGNHAMTLYSDYYIYATFDSSDNLVKLKIDTLFYVPIGSGYSSNYVYFSYVLSAIGDSTIEWPGA